MVTRWTIAFRKPVLGLKKAASKCGLGAKPSVFDFTFRCKA